eukprot:TRINITY_DN8459_c0_g1_i1.p2 TRINITY_DN8459_c0_g1~~TRINITY_DN8459_c0_g1_i1.p2  ORF type:complete len:317 (+),score=55.21 TRINITY_DN8459_c0_g1_i1:1418-2368(+)
MTQHLPLTPMYSIAPSHTHTMHSPAHPAPSRAASDTLHQSQTSLSSSPSPSIGSPSIQGTHTLASLASIAPLSVYPTQQAYHHMPHPAHQQMKYAPGPHAPEADTPRRRSTRPRTPNRLLLESSAPTPTSQKRPNTAPQTKQARKSPRKSRLPRAEAPVTVDVLGRPLDITHEVENTCFGGVRNKLGTRPADAEEVGDRVPLYCLARLWSVDSLSPSNPEDVLLDMMNGAHMERGEQVMPPPRRHADETPAKPPAIPIRPQADFDRTIRCTVDVPPGVLLSNHLSFYRTVRTWTRSQHHLRLMRFEERLNTILPDR